MTEADKLASLGVSPEVAAKIVDLAAGGSPIASTNVTVDAFNVGGVNFAGGNLQQALEAIAAETTA